MNLWETINENAVAANAKAQNKEEVFEYVCDLLLKGGSITSKGESRQDLYIRESRRETGIGGRIAIPHGKSLVVKRNCILVLKLERPTQQGTLDDRPTQMFIIFTINQRDKDDYFLRLMASVAKRLAQGETCGKLMGNSTKEDILEAFYQGVITPPGTGRRQRTNIVGVTMCTADIMYTYTVKGKLKQATRKLGYTCRIETQGSIGMEEQLAPGEVEAVDVVILAIDVKVSGENRLEGKSAVRMNTEKATKSTGALLQSIEEALAKKKNGES